MKFGVREGLFAILLLGLPLSAWWFVFRPGNQQHQEIRKQVDAKQEKLRKLNKLVGKVGNLEKEIGDLEKAIDFFKKKLPNEKEIAKVLDEISRLAKASHLITKSVTPLKRHQGERNLYASGSHAELAILIRLEGSFKGFYSFLQALENQPRIMRISRMTLEKSEEEGEGRITADFEMSVFFERVQEG